MQLDTVLVAVSLLLGSFAFAIGIKKLEISTVAKTLLLVGELTLMVAGYIQLGLLGLILAIAVSVFGLMIYSVRIYAVWEEHLIYAATQARVEPSLMKSLCKELRRTDKAFALLGLVGTAELISLLSQRKRSVDDIRKMARPVALLWVIHRLHMGVLVSKFDQILRLYRRTPAEAMEIADKISLAARISAATFEETLDAMIAAGSFAGHHEDQIAS